MKLCVAIRCFDSQLQADGKSEHTRGAYLRDLERFRAWAGKDSGVETITPDILARFFASNSCAGRPAISANHTKTALRVFFKFLTDAGHINSNPARLIKNGRTEPKTPEHLTAQELRHFLGAIPMRDGSIARRDRVMFALLLWTGIRLGSLVRLKVCDVRLNEHTLKVSGKGGGHQTVYLKTGLRRLLKSYIRTANLNSDNPLFPSRNGGHLGRRQVQLRFHLWLDRAGIKRQLTVHCTRHTFAMNLYRKTGDLRLVQTALGHRHISSTEIYARVEDNTLRRAIEKM